MSTHEIHEHHDKAAEHHEHAAKHHREAAKHAKDGDHEKSAHHSKVAHGHEPKKSRLPALDGNGLAQVVIDKSAEELLRIARQRLAYAVASERMTQHNASMQIIAEGATRCRVIWITDVLPNEIASYIEAQMELGAAAMQKTFGSGGS